MSFYQQLKNRLMGHVGNRVLVKCEDEEARSYWTSKDYISWVENGCLVNTDVLELDISFSKIGALTPLIGNLPNLRLLNISRNNLMILPESIWTLSKLETLLISVNHLKEIPSDIGKLTRLESLYATENPFWYIAPEVYVIRHKMM